MLLSPKPAQTFHDFQPFGLACKARDLLAQLDALKQNAQGRVPTLAEPSQDMDAKAPHYTPGVSQKAVL